MKRVTVLVAVLLLVAAACDVKDLIVTPKDGSFAAGSTVTVTGKLPNGAAAGGTLVVNGLPTTIAPDGTWSQVVPTVPTEVVTPIEAIYTDPGGTPWRQRQAVINGESLEEREYSPDGVGMRFTNTGLTNLGPVIKSLAGGAFDIGGLLLSQNPIVNQQDAFLTIDITGNAYEAGIGGVDIAPLSTAGGVKTDITIEDLFVGLDLHLSDGLLINLDCRLELQIPETTINATFDLAPTAGNPSKVDVNMVGAPTVNTGTVGYEFISGICDGDTFLIGDIVNSLAGGQIQALIGDGFATNLGDPDGSGPLDSPIAGAIQTALGEISIAGSVGEAVKANLDAPFTQINETADAIDFRANADFYSTFGTGPTDCVAPPGAPNLDATYDLPGAYPNLGATTPSGDPYGLGLVIAGSAFNQLLGSMTECGILNQTVTEISLGGPPLPITSSLLAFLAPQFATKLPAGTPMRIEVVPTAAPFLSADAGPNGETAELNLANLHIKFIENRAGIGDLTHLTLAVDAPLGFDLAYDPVAGVLAPQITAPPAGLVKARVVDNGIEVGEPAIEALFPTLFPTFVSALGSSFAAFPLPSFLGLGLEVLEVQRAGNYFVLYSNLNPVPQTRIENVSVTDLSTADSVTDSLFDVNEWRHRMRPTVSPNGVVVNFKGVIGADACCTVDDEQKSAHAGYRVTLDVVPENGETWKLDIGQLMNGAHTIIDEKVLLEDAGGESRFTTPINARVRIGAGAWTNFNATPSVNSVVHGLYGGEGTSNRAFTASSSTILTGTTAQTITVEFGFDMFVKSNSNAFFPAAGGDEAALRFGANDTITNGFTAGGYPGLGNRNLLTDGHFGTIQLTTVP
jgi:hypothetical protein